mmetsp:Transcript_679/g.1321  ORF Transcript_679/g.1321 Transcript_679/m.1321 type:complete len:210 (-) Transcript_679:192-821(-)
MLCLSAAPIATVDTTVDTTVGETGKILANHAATEVARCCGGGWCFLSLRTVAPCFRPSRRYSAPANTKSIWMHASQPSSVIAREAKPEHTHGTAFTAFRNHSAGRPPKLFPSDSAAARSEWPTLSCGSIDDGPDSPPPCCFFAATIPTKAESSSELSSASTWSTAARHRPAPRKSNHGSPPLKLPLKPPSSENHDTRTAKTPSKTCRGS